MGYTVRVAPGDAIDLAGIDPRADGGLAKAAGEERLKVLAAELGELQELLYAAGTHAALLVLQGMDTSGKDGTIRHVLADVNPLGCRVVGFKAPTPIELRHDFLWRVHRGTPELGILGVFNRSHYEDVLVARVRGLVPAPVWRGRYAHINAFEALLAAGGTLIAKCFLHISREEQEERLLARERDVTRAWKLSAGDWEERTRWDAYLTAYADSLAACSTDRAPWHVVPSDRKWFRNLAVAEVLVELLRPHRDGWLAALDARGREELAAIRAARAAGNVPLT